MMIKVSGKSAHLAQRCYFYLKTAIKHRWNLSKDKFWPKTSMQNSAYQYHYIWNFSASGMLDIFIKDWGNTFIL